MNQLRESNRFNHPQFPSKPNFDPSISNTENFLSHAWLRKEVGLLKAKPLETGKTPWYFLAGTGFFVKEQVSQLIRNTSSTMGKVAPDILDLELAKVREDSEHFVKEYLEQMLNLKLNLAWANVNGKNRIICPRYGNALWESVTDAKERDGVVLETVRKTEGWLRDAPNDSFAIIVSPEGWSGILDADGNNIRFSETQMNAIHKKADGQLEAYTFRYSANFAENIRIQMALGMGDQIYPNTGDSADNQKTMIKNILNNPVFISGKDVKRPIGSFEDIINVIQKTLGNRVEAREGKTFDEMRAFLRNPDSFDNIHPLALPLIQRFQEYAKSEFNQYQTSSEREQNLQIGLAITILQLNKIYRTQEENGSTNVAYKSGFYPNVRRAIDANLIGMARNMLRQHMNYLQEKEELEKRPGCAGGGNKFQLNSMGSPISAELANSKESENYDFDHEGTCVVCKQGPKNLGPCDICISCDAELGGKAASMAA